jgi:hypothetical protein
MIIADHCQPGSIRGQQHTPVCDWPDDCFVQWGSLGIVFQNKDMVSSIETIADAIIGDEAAREKIPEVIKGAYVTAFFEAFPRNPDTFLRGEGSSIEAAEISVFAKFTKHQNCPGHEYERRNYRNGAGFCIHCGMFKSKAFEPLERCVKCDTPTFHAMDTNNQFWCETCSPGMPEELKPEYRKRMEEWQKEDDDSENANEI